eukprot:TRINITY_DN2533_c0_g1_i3.p1 TRINITY_DN2533_c0_g1~~TRINITY_DN2533_c0_g1_i3.p1  ORF type:complete len:507 (+),score=34.77 TRINITY_DN2533_c0_g1_i3:85-1521(+)
MSSGGHGTASARQQRPQSARLQGSSFRAAGAAACMLAAGLAWYVSRSSSVTGPRGLSKKVQRKPQAASLREAAGEASRALTTGLVAAPQQPATSAPTAPKQSSAAPAAQPRSMPPPTAALLAASQRPTPAALTASPSSGTAKPSATLQPSAALQPTPNSKFGPVRNGTAVWVNGPTGARRHAVVVDTSAARVKVHYSGFSTDFDEWMESAGRRFQGPAPDTAPDPVMDKYTLPSSRHGFKVGDLVAVFSASGVPRNGTVAATTADKVMLHYPGFSPDHGEWIDATSDHLKRGRAGAPLAPSAKLNHSRQQHPGAESSKHLHRPGDIVQVQSPSGSWRSTTVLAAEPTRVKVHYNGFDSAYDEWVPIGPRIHSLSQPGSAPPPAPPSVALPPPPSVALPPPAGSPSAVAPPAVPAGPLPTYTVGQSVEVMSSTDQRRSTKVVQVEPGRIKVHYEGFDPWYDEWIDLGSPRLLGPAAPAK